MASYPGQCELIPPYCPNPGCLFHQGTDKVFYVKNGLTPTQKPPFSNQRFRCKECRAQFSSNTFKLDFRKRLPDLSEKVLQYCLNGMSNNSAALILGVSESTIRNRLKELARQSLFFEKEHALMKADEDIAYDGFETFTHSQYSPCYINTAVGARSHFIYHTTFSPLNRKGRMTEHQKKANQDLMKKFGPYPRDAVYEETCHILRNLSRIAPGRKLYTDEHRAYLKAVRSFDCKLKHHTISSRERRDQFNPLFPANRLHNLYRHYFSSQQRETIAFQKHEAALLEKMQLMKIYRNFMNPKFKKKTRFDVNAHEWSPAMYLGIVDEVLGFHQVFGIRRQSTQVRLDSREKNFVLRRYPYSRRVIAV